MAPRIKIDSDYLLKTLRKMIEINSVLPREEALASFIAEEIRSFGIDPEWQEVAPGRPNVYASAVLGPSDKFLVFSGHSDTVPPASDWESDPFQPEEKDNRLYGLGAINMKAGLACVLTAFKALVENKRLYNQMGRIGLAVVVDQEGCSIGARALLNTEYGHCDAMLHAEHFFGDSKENYLPSAVTGKILYKLTVRGKAAHAFRPHLGGINAVDDAAGIIAALDKLKMRDHPVLGRGTICVLKIEGGYKEYAIVVPELCEIIITRLTVPGETVNTAIDDLQELIDSLKLESTVTIETPPPNYEPYFLDENLPVVICFRDVYKDIIGREPFFAGHKGIVDANVFAGEGGIPTIVFGPKGGRHHMAGEYVELPTLEPVAGVYAGTAINFLSDNK